MNTISGKPFVEILPNLHLRCSWVERRCEICSKKHVGILKVMYSNVTVTEGTPVDSSHKDCLVSKYFCSKSHFVYFFCCKAGVARCTPGNLLID